MKKFTILIAVIALVCFSVPAMANDWNFYGSARMSTNYVSDDFQNSGTTVGGDDDTKDAGTNWLLQGNSRIGARVKGEHLSGRFEYGTGVNVRLLYGEWDFGGGKLLVGQDYTPSSQFISTSIYGNIAEDSNLLGTGAFYGSREAQLKLSFGGFQVALVENDNADDLGSDGDVDVYLPKLEVGWGMGFDTWSFNLMGGAATYSIEDATNTAGTDTNNITVTSYMIGADGQVAFGPLTLKAAISAGRNVGNAWGSSVSLGSGILKDNGKDIDDTDAYQASLVGVFKLSDMWAFEGGVGYRADDPDSNNARLDKELQAYLQAFITLAPGVYILPEVGYIDHYNNTNGKSAGDTVYAGAKWQIDF